MTKLEFLLALRKKLSGFPDDDVQERLGFYSEMIEDRMEEGLSEEEAVKAVGSVDKIAEQVTADPDVTSPSPAKHAPEGHLKAWEIVLLILGFPLWFSLIAAVFAVALTLYITLWSLALSLWIIFAALILCAICFIAAGIGFVAIGQTLSGVALAGAGLICAGLGIFLFFGCRATTKGLCICTKNLVLRAKNRFTKKEGAK